MYYESKYLRANTFSLINEIYDFKQLSDYGHCPISTFLARVMQTYDLNQLPRDKEREKDREIRKRGKGEKEKERRERERKKEKNKGEREGQKEGN